MELGEMVMIGGMAVQTNGIPSFIRESKERGKVDVFGCPIATSAPKMFHEAGFDFPVYEEAEHTMPLLMAGMGNGCFSFPNKTANACRGGVLLFGQMLESS